MKERRPKTQIADTHTDTVNKEDGIVRASWLWRALSMARGFRLSSQITSLPFPKSGFFFLFFFYDPFFRFFFSGDCFGDMGFHELAMSLLDRPRTFFRTNNGGYASETTTETKKEAMNPLPSSVVSSSTSGTESFLEIAVYMHSFHNLDLFQQGYVSFLVLFSLFQLHFKIDLW